MLVSEEHPLNAKPPILVTLLGMVMLVSEVQPPNALLPILVTLLGIVMLVSEEQPLNAESPILVPSVITTVLREDGTQSSLEEENDAPKIYPKCVLLVPSLVAPTKGIVMLSSALQSANAELPILVTLLGIVMLVSEEQPLNA